MGGAGSFPGWRIIMTAYNEALTLEQVIARVCSGEPIHWLTVHDSNGDVYDMAVAASRPADNLRNDK
jgi:hypothetical protein